MKRLLALLYGIGAYVLFLGAFAYTFAFLANIVVPKTIDSGLMSPVPTAIAIDALLLSAFAVQHSVMARKGFKRVWTRIVPPFVERSTYVLAADLVLILLLWQWRAIPGTVWDLRGTIAGTLLTLSFCVGCVVLLVSTCLVNHFELFGLAQVWSYFKGRELHPPSFKTPGLYRVVRHPIYFGFIIVFWSAPRMSVGHLIFSIATTGYILLGIAFEERDLIASYGKKYLDYRQQVPMLLPIPRLFGGSKEVGRADGREGV